MNNYRNKYKYLYGFFIGDFQYLENDSDILNYFQRNNSEIILCINEISNFINDANLDWNSFINETNIHFSSKNDLFKFLIWLKNELVKF